MERLSLLDEHWSAYLEAAHSQELEGEPDFQGLLELADQIDNALGAAAEAASDLRVMLEQLNGADPEQVIALIREGDSATADVIGEVLDDLDEARPQKAFITACRFLEGNTAAERELLSRKREQLMARVLPDPDLTPIERCMLTIAEIGCIWTLAAGGALSGLGTPIAIGVGVVGGAAQLTKMWKKSGCKKAWKRARGAFAT
jgi:hypothetical protein